MNNATERADAVVHSKKELIAALHCVGGATEEYVIVLVRPNGKTTTYRFPKGKLPEESENSARRAAQRARATPKSAFE